MSTARTTLPAKEPIFALPTGRLVAVVVGAAVALAVVWVLVGTTSGWPRDKLLAGPLGALVSGAVGALGLLVMQPWRPRDASWWATFWLAATVVRLLVTPAVAFLLYSATSPAGTPFLLSVAATYLLIVFGEVAVLTLHVGRSTP